MRKNRTWTALILTAVIATILLCNGASPATTAPRLASTPATAATQAIEPTRIDAKMGFLRRVLQRHPKTEVSGVLWPKVVDGTVAIRWLANPNADGRFSPMLVTNADGDVTGLRGTLFVPIWLVERARHRDLPAMAYLELVLLHESIHYEQVAAGRFPSSIFGRPLFSREDCDAGWRLEREAYDRECRYAKERKIESVAGPYCSASDPAAFDRALLPALVENRTDGCPALWSKAIPK